VITVDKNAAYPKAMSELKTPGELPESCDLRWVKYLNNIVEQDHRFINDASNRDWASFRLRRRGERYKDMRS
jgi:transposase-like protein